MTSFEKDHSGCLKANEAQVNLHVSTLQSSCCKAKNAGASKIDILNSQAKGKRMFIYISIVSLAGKNHWLLVVDDSTDYAKI